MFQKLKQSIIIVQGVNSLSLRYSIYKVQTRYRACSLPKKLSYYSIESDHCQVLFKGFLNFPEEICHMIFCRSIRICSKKPHQNDTVFKCWHYLSSRAVTRQVLSTQMSLTSVFGMGTGGPSSQSIPTLWMAVTPSFMSKLLSSNISGIHPEN